MSKSTQVVPPPLDFHISDPKYKALFLALGRATMYWAALEHELSVWFVHVSKMKEQMGNDVFFSANSFRGRLDILKAAVLHARIGKDMRELIDAVARKASDYATFRNDFVHGMPLTASGPFVGTVPMIVDGSGKMTQEKLEAGITVEKLDRAASNFASLTNVIIDAQAARRSPVRLRALRAQVEQLPNVPASGEPSQKQRGRAKQRQADALKLARQKNSGKARSASLHSI